MILDTSFLIDLQREFHSRKHGPACQFLELHSKSRFHISIISVIEFLEGFDEQSQGEVLLRSFSWIEVDVEIARHAASIRRNLRQKGTLIGDFDILIASTALVHGQALVTDNQDHFGRVNDLEVIDYRIR